MRALRERNVLRRKRTWPFALQMSAFGPKRTSVAAPHMSALGGKADIAAFATKLAKRRLPLHPMFFCRLIGWNTSASVQANNSQPLATTVSQGY
jgi:hypothetical protein